MKLTILTLILAFQCIVANPTTNEIRQLGREELQTEHKFLPVETKEASTSVSPTSNLAEVSLYDDLMSLGR